MQFGDLRPPPAISIRPYALGDAPDLFEAARESVVDVHPWLPWCHPAYAIDEAHTWVQSQVHAFASGAEYEFVILSPSGRYAGGCGVNFIQREQRRGNLGYWVRSSEMARGFASAAARLVARWAFEHTDLERLEILVATGNVRSLRAAEKTGATREGVLRRRLLIHGTCHDAVVFSLVRGDPLA